MNPELSTSWFISLLPALWAVFLCGLTLRVGSQRLPRLLVMLLLFISWMAHTPVCGYILAFNGAALLRSYLSLGAWLTLGTLSSGLALVWIAHPAAIATIWASKDERARVVCALIFPTGWLLIGLSYALWRIGEIAR